MFLQAFFRKLAGLPQNPPAGMMTIFMASDGFLKAVGEDGTLYVLSRTVGTPVDLTPEAGNSSGSGNALALANHIHNVASDVPVVNTLNGTPTEGTSSAFARADHNHGIPVAAPSSTGAANAVGTSSSLARADHVHNVEQTRSFVSATSSFTTTSATDTLVNAMQVVAPTPGKYAVFFSGIISNSGGGNTMTFTIYSSGIAVTDSIRSVLTDSGGGADIASSQSFIQVGSSATIEIRAKTNAGTLTVTNRNLLLIRLGD